MQTTNAPRTLLVVDADFEMANAVADAALEHGWEPLLAGGPEAALGILPRLDGPTLVLVDLVSPVSGGLALMVALRRRAVPSFVRVVVLTGSHPVPAVVRKAHVVIGAVKRPRHPTDAPRLVQALDGLALEHGEAATG